MELMNPCGVFDVRSTPLMTGPKDSNPMTSKPDSQRLKQREPVVPPAFMSVRRAVPCRARTRRHRPWHPDLGNG